MFMDWKGFDWKAYTGNLHWLRDRTCMLTKHGSHAYGTNRPESDKDFKGIAVPPSQYFHGFMHHFEQAIQQGNGIDMTVYDIRKFFNMAADCNPSIIEVLWVDESDIIQIDDVGDQLRNIRKMFLSKRAKHTFSGYAMSQLKRIKTHRGWLLNPPTHEPTREEFGLPIHMKASASELGAFEALEGGDEEIIESGVLPKDVVTLFLKERKYRSAKTYWSQYQNWKKTRNPERAAIEERFGYDCKHGMHLVRLMRMAEEIAKSGEVWVRRPDKEELLAIRDGAWSYDGLMIWAEDQEDKLDVAFANSDLPREVDREALDRICRSIVASSLTRMIPEVIE